MYHVPIFLGGSASYQYDPLGRRQMLTENGTTTTFLHDGDEEIADYASTTVLRRYVPGPGIDMPIAMVTASGGTRKYFHTNRQGSTIAMSADNGTIAEGPYTYDEYGNGALTTGVPFKYTGRRLDPGTGLYYYRARYYSAALGRFLQVDPIGYRDQMNLYGYVSNDPLNAIDPFGLDTWSFEIGGSLVIGWGVRGSLGISYDDETGQVTITGSVGARLGMEGGVSGKATQEESPKKPTPDGADAKITVTADASVGPLGGEKEIGSINNKGEVNGPKEGEKGKAKVKAGGNFKLKASGTVGADLKGSVRFGSKQSQKDQKKTPQKEPKSPCADPKRCPK